MVDLDKIKANVEQKRTDNSIESTERLNKSAANKIKVAESPKEFFRGAEQRVGILANDGKYQSPKNLDIIKNHLLNNKGLYSAAIGGGLLATKLLSDRKKRRNIKK